MDNWIIGIAGGIGFLLLIFGLRELIASAIVKGLGDYEYQKQKGKEIHGLMEEVAFWSEDKKDKK